MCDVHDRCDAVFHYRLRPDLPGRDETSAFFFFFFLPWLTYCSCCGSQGFANLTAGESAALASSFFLESRAFRRAIILVYSSYEWGGKQFVNWFCFEYNMKLQISRPTGSAA